MKRVLTLVGGILGTTFQAIFTLIMLIGLSAGFNDAVDATFGTAAVIVVGVVILLFSVATLTLNAVSIGCFACSTEKFNRRRGLLITATVFNFVMALVLLITVMSSFLMIMLLFTLASIATAVMFIVDICMENDRVAKAAHEQQLKAAQQKNGGFNETK